MDIESQAQKCCQLAGHEEAIDFYKMILGVS